MLATTTLLRYVTSDSWLILRSLELTSHKMDIVMEEGLPLKITHDVGQTLQRKLEGLARVERAFVHVDYEHEHDVNEEHKPLYRKNEKGRSLKDILLRRKPAEQQTSDQNGTRGGVLG